MTILITEIRIIEAVLYLYYYPSTPDTDNQWRV